MKALWIIAALGLLAAPAMALEDTANATVTLTIAAYATVWFENPGIPINAPSPGTWWGSNTARVVTNVAGSLHAALTTNELAGFDPVVANAQGGGGWTDVACDAGVQTDAAVWVSATTALTDPPGATSATLTATFTSST